MLSEKLEKNPTLLVLAWLGAAVGAITLGVQTQGYTPIVDLLGQSTADGVYLALGAAGLVSAAEDLGFVERDDFPGA